MKLPKQWLHWAASMHLKPESPRRSKWSGFSLKGRGRRWRINMYGEFQMGDLEAQFDRWANSLRATVPMPKTQAEFQNAVRSMENTHD